MRYVMQSLNPVFLLRHLLLDPKLGQAALTASVLALTLSACSTSADPATNTDAPTDFAYVATVDPQSYSQAELEAMYGGTALVYRPEAGLSVLGFTDEEGQLTTASAEPNADISSPEAHASGFNAWASGFNAWASGFNAWASGFNAWASGTGSLADLNLPYASVKVLETIDLEDALHRSRHQGDGIKVAVIDSGLDLDHPLFSNRLAPVSQWKDYVDGDSYPEDEKLLLNNVTYGHGTAVAGIIVQLAPNAQILPIRVLNANGTGQIADVISAIDHAVASGADIINLSLGTDTDVEAMRSMMDYATSKGVYIVAAAGNNGAKAIDFPADYARWTTVQDRTRIISVGSLNSNQQRSSFSNYSGTLEFLLPGETVFSAYPDGAGTFTGTSFSTSIASGMAALVLAENPNADVETELVNASTSIKGSFTGWGMPNAKQLMHYESDY